MKTFAIFSFLVVKSTAIFKGFTRPNDGQQHRSMENQEQLIKVYDNEKDFVAELEKYNMVPMVEDFSSFLKGASQADLVEGKNDVGVFDIVIKSNEKRNDTYLGAIREEDGGSFYGIYDKNEVSVLFDYFADATAYAFSATWDIDQEYEGALSEKLHIQLGSGLRSYRLNLVDFMHQQNTRFIGFIDDFKGFRSMEVFTINSTGPIAFSMSEVMMSTTQPDPKISFLSFLISAQETAESMVGVFGTGGFFGPGGFYENVILKTYRFFFGNDGVFMQIMTRLVTVTLFSGDADER